MKLSLLIIYSGVIGMSFSCGSPQQKPKNILVGHWYVSKLTSHKKILIETPQTKTESSTDHFIFTNDKVCHYMTENDKIIKSDTSAYTLSTDNKTLIVYYAKNKADTMILNYSGEDEFSIEDNMGLILTVKRKK